MRRGRPPPAAASRRSTSAPRRTASSTTSASTPRARDAVVDGQPLRSRREHRGAAHGRRRRPDRGLPRRPRARRRRPARLARRRLPRRRGPPRARPGPAHGRGARRARRRRPAGRARATTPRSSPGWSPSPRPPSPTGSSTTAVRLVLVTGDDLSGQRTATRDQSRMPARRKRQIDPLELKAGDYVVHEQHGVGRFVEMRQREVQGATREYLVLEYGASKRGGPARPAVRPGRQPRPGDPLRRRRAAQPRPARRLRLGQAQGPRPQGGPRDRRRADQAVRRAAGHPGPRLRPGHPVAARARGRVPLPRDPRPADHGRGGQGRHAPDRPDGPAGLRRRRLRQDRDRGAGGVQGGPGRQAGRRARADDAAGAAALLDVRRADGRRSR